ncbi:Insulin protein enhancer protein isl-1 [Blomia tropicalis]|nr:Insulin protein enhancer protein isl-1 [Blomia tropicalis]
MAVATAMPTGTEPSSNSSPLSLHLGGKWSRISLCVGCGSEIYDQYILRVHPDLEWHAACLKCADCHQYLDESCTCFVRDGKTYCKRDYLRLFGAKCAKCSLGFNKTDLVMRARNKIYHVDCFRCVVCTRQLTRGDEFALREDDLFCKADHEVVIDPKIILSSNSSASSSSSSSLTPLTPVTPDCLKENGLIGLGPNASPLTVLNSNGSIPPPGPPMNSMPLHPAGVIPGPGGDLNGHMNSSNISPSGGAGAPTHLSAMTGVHLEHHTSLTGAQGISPVGQGGMPQSLTPTMNGAGNGPGSGHHHSNSKNNSGSSSGSNNSSTNSHRSSHRSMHGSKNPDHKPTRVRTVLNEKQLQTLRNCYNANPRPDALMKEQLVEITGLSPRVIRVWFQNKRCKDKKRSILIKQMQQQEKDGRQLNIGQMRGVPLIATSPVRHESPVQMNPLDVHSYQPPWKALADYASMQPDIDPNAPQFQHLVSQMHGYNDGLSTPNDTSLSSLGHGGPPTGPCTPMSYLGKVYPHSMDRRVTDPVVWIVADADMHQTHSNMSSDLSSPCTSE